MGGSAKAPPTADQFAQGLTSLSDAHKIVSFYAQGVTVHTAELMERMAKEMLMKPTQITSALTIPPPVGKAIVRLTTTQTTPTTSSTTCALSVGEQLIRTLKHVAQENAQLPLHLSRVFAKAVKPFLELPRTAANKALVSSTSALVPISSSASALSSSPTKASSSGSANGPHSSSARNRRLPQATQPSPVGTSTDTSSGSYATPNERTDRFGTFESIKMC